ncbi:MAG: DUF1330 domain-containing protein [Myxococcales bacterium]|nr:MAG: DUF1330 domain-containing protein [Myxococcales bacterium]
MEILIGLEVRDDAMYREYRARMTPLLLAHGGSFGVDVRVAEVLKSPQPGAFNRLFTIRFPSVAAHDTFFGNAEYLAIRRQWFEPGVGLVTHLGRYEVLP